MMRTAQLAQLSDAELVAAYGRMESPGVRVNFVTSADGAMTVDGLSAGLSGEADKRVFRVLRMLCDGLLVGAGTFRRENYRPLTLDVKRRAWREQAGLTPYPRLVVVSATLDLDPAHPALAAAPVRPIILQPAPPLARPQLQAVADVVNCPDLRTGLAELRERGLEQLLCEGGPQLFGALTAADLVDELCLTVAPVLAGPGAGRIVAGPPHPPRRLHPAHAFTAADGTLLLRYLRSH